MHTAAALQISVGAMLRPRIDYCPSTGRLTTNPQAWRDAPGLECNTPYGGIDPVTWSLQDPSSSTSMSAARDALFEPLQ